MGKKLLAAWICLGLLFIVAGYLFTYQEHIRLNLSRIALTQEILTDIYDLQNNLTEAEAAAREHVITGAEPPLNAYRTAVREIGRIQGELQELSAGDADQERLVHNLQRSLKQRLRLFNQAIDLRREKGAEAPEHAALKKDGDKLQDNIRKILDKMEEVEKRHLDPQWAQGKAKRQRYLALLAGGSFASFTILLVVFYLLNREIHQRKQAEDSLARYQEDLRNLASQLSLAEERERRRLALHLHDQIGHTLALAKIRLGQVQEETAAGDDRRLQERLQESRALVEQAIVDTQSLTFRISPPVLYELGLEPALEWLTEHFSTQYGLRVRFETDHQSRPAGQDLDILLFQAVNELLFNVVKHARAHEINVSLWADDNLLKVGVDDDGQGFSPAAPDTRHLHTGGFGLFSIRERLKPFGGRLEVHSQPGDGTQVTISIPLSPPAPGG